MEYCCCVCKHNRCQIRLLPCNHVAHARCIYPWPVNICPVCRIHVNDVVCLEIQQYTNSSESYSISSRSKVFGLVRDEAWSSNETEYFDAVVSSFHSTMMPMEEGITLPVVVCSLLQCLPSRLSNKRINAKTEYESNLSVLEVSDIVNYLKLQVQLSAAEDRFLKHISFTCGIEDASIVSYHMQHFWLRNFVKSKGGKHLNVIKSFPKESQEYITTGIFKVANQLTDYLYSGSAHEEGIQFRISEYFKLMPFEIGVCFSTTSHKIFHSTFAFQNLISNSASSDTKRKQEQEQEEWSTELDCSLNVLELMLQDASVLIRALTDNNNNNTASGANYGYQELVEELLPQSVLPCQWLPVTRRVFHRWAPNLMALNGSILVRCSFSLGVHFISEELAVAAISFERQDPDIEILESRNECIPMTSLHDQYLNSNLLEESMEIESPSTRSSKKSIPEMYKRRRIIVDNMYQYANSHSDVDSKLSESAGTAVMWAMNLPDKCFDWANMIALPTGGPRLISAYDVIDPQPIVSPRHKVLSPYPPLVVDNAMARILKKCISRTPFQLIELWFPTIVNGKRILLFGGSATDNELLLGWSVYSRGFAFEENEGIPGRICTNHEVEQYEDVRSLPQSRFLRLDGARQLGIRASIGIPLHQSRPTNAVTSSSAATDTISDQEHGCIEMNDGLESNSNAVNVEPRWNSRPEYSSSPVIAVLYSVEAFPVTEELLARCQRKLNNLSVSSSFHASSIGEETSASIGEINSVNVSDNSGASNV